MTDIPPSGRFGGGDLAGRWLRVSVGVACAYAIGSLAAGHIFGANEIGLSFFPAAGVTSAACILLPRREWLFIGLGIVVAEFAVNASFHLPVGSSAGYALANLVEPMVGAAILGVLSGRSPGLDLRSRRGLLIYGLGPLGGGPLVGGLIGATVKSVVAPETSWLSNVLHWWVGDGLGVLTVGSAILVCLESRRSPIWRSWLELVCLVAVTTAVSVLVFVVWNELLVYLVLPCVLVAAVRLETVGVAITGVAVAVVANFATVNGDGPFSTLDTVSQQTQLGLTQLFVAVTMLSAWYLAIETIERATAVEMVERARGEHEAVTRLQETLLTHRLATTDAVRMVAKYRPAARPIVVGGDWYDAVALSEDRVMMIVGDVVGRGIEAALTMGQLRSAARILSFRLGPAELLTELDSFVGDVEGAPFTTVCCVLVDPRRGVITYSVAGHPPPLLRLAAGGVGVLLGGRAAPLGFALGGRVDAVTSFADGDVLMMYTDGLIERPGEVIDLGIRRLAGEFATIDVAAGDWTDRIIDRCIPATVQPDDIAVLAGVLSTVDVLGYVIGPRPSELATQRRLAASWLAARGVDPVTVQEVIVALGEASTNVCVHAYFGTEVGEGCSATVDIHLWAGSRLVITVTDQGRWRVHDDPTRGGRGLGMMSRLMDEVDVERRVDGTTVTLVKSLVNPTDGVPGTRSLVAADR